MATKISPFKYNIERNYNEPFDLSSVHSSYALMQEYVANNTAGWYSGQIISVNNETSDSYHPYYTYAFDGMRYIVPLMTSDDQQSSYDSLYSYVTTSYAYSLSYTGQAYMSLSAYISDTYTLAIDTAKQYVETYTYTKIAEVIGSAPESFDTLKEIADWITYDTSGTEVLIARITAIENNIEDDELTISTSLNDLRNDTDINTYDISYNSTFLQSEIRGVASSIGNLVQDLNHNLGQFETQVNSYISNINQTIEDDELTISTALNDLNDKIDDISYGSAEDLSNLTTYVYTLAYTVDGHDTTLNTYGQILASHMVTLTQMGAQVSYSSDQDKLVYMTIGQRSYAHINSIDVQVKTSPISITPAITEGTYGLVFTERSYTTGLIDSDMVAAVNADEEVIVDQINNLSYGVVNNALQIDQLAYSSQYCSLSDKYTIGEIFRALLDTPTAHTPNYNNITSITYNNGQILSGTLNATEYLSLNSSYSITATYNLNINTISINISNIDNLTNNSTAGQSKAITAANIDSASYSNFSGNNIIFGTNNTIFKTITPQLGPNQIFSKLTVSYDSSNPAYYTQLANKNVYIMCDDPSASFNAGSFTNNINYSVNCLYPCYWGFGSDLPTDPSQLIHRSSYYYSSTGTTTVRITDTVAETPTYFYVAFPKDIYARTKYGTNEGVDYYWEGVNDTGSGPLDSAIATPGITTNPITINNTDYILSYIKHDTQFSNIISVSAKIIKV